MKLFAFHNWRNSVTTLGEDTHRLGFLGAMKLLCAQVLTILMKDFGFPRWHWSLRLHSRDLVHPVTFRLCSSDVYTLRQILVAREHGPVSALAGIRFIVDCGANIGVSAAWLLCRYPEANLVAIEPDPENFALLETNLAPYGKRARAIRAAVWPKEGESLRCVRGSFADGLDWSATVGPAGASEADTDGVTLERVMAESGHPTIDLCKMDIEGAECLLFRADCGIWLARTRHLCVELHGQECERAFNAAMNAYLCERVQSNELTVCTDIRPRSIGEPGKPAEGYVQ